jgi:hypothetical protein
MTGREIVAALRCANQRCECSRGKVTHCPAHDDKHPSLSVSEKDGKTLVHCLSGCAQASILAALEERGLWGDKATPAHVSRGGGRLVKVYEFRNAAGELVAEKGRFEGANGKSFSWRVPGKDWKDGLGTIALHDLPLYRLGDVIAKPEAMVWMVEGEKAADACAERGLVAVCCGGGASQQSFGNMLDALRDREVVLWPDNDDPGAAFAGRIHALLPQSRYVRPIVPPKGDAYDYFAAGGSVEALGALLVEDEPAVSVIDNVTVMVDMPVPNGKVNFQFGELSTSGPRAVDAEMVITPAVPGVSRTPFNSRINLASASGREGIRREIEGVYGKGSLTWTALLNQSCTLAQQAWKGIDCSVDLADVALPEERAWAVERFAAKGVVTIIFGMGGTGKSFVCADIILHALMGEPWASRKTDHADGVMVIDYEDREDEWRLRVQQLCDGYGWSFPERGFRYYPGRAIPVADQMPQLTKVVQDNGIGFVIVDSAVSACGGDLLDTQAAARLINALNSLGVTTLLIAHSAKGSDEKSEKRAHEYPYGNIFWHNLARATYYLESTEGENGGVNVALYNRKSNRGKQPPVYLTINFPSSDLGPVSINSTAWTSSAPVTSTEGNQREIIRECIEQAGTALTAKEISEQTGIEQKTVSAQLSKNPEFTSPERTKWVVNSRQGVTPW